MRFPSLFILTFLVILVSGCSLFKKSSRPLSGPEMVYVKGGTFTMGNVFDEKHPDARPPHTARGDDFYIGRHEVTLSQYNAFAQRTDRSQIQNDSLTTGNSPVVQITWQEARTYCRYFGYRLPTEPEWEYAARSGGKHQQFAGTNVADSLSRYAHVSNSHIDYPLPVGIKKPNGLGLYDMSGNVFEWIGDYYRLYPEDGNAPTWKTEKDQVVRMIRGGSFQQNTLLASTFWRAAMLATGRDNDVGFRCVSDAE